MRHFGARRCRKGVSGQSQSSTNLLGYAIREGGGPTSQFKECSKRCSWSDGRELRPLRVITAVAISCCGIPQTSLLCMRVICTASREDFEDRRTPKVRGSREETLNELGVQSSRFCNSGKPQLELIAYPEAQQQGSRLCGSFFMSVSRKSQQKEAKTRTESALTKRMEQLTQRTRKRARVAVGSFGFWGCGLRLMIILIITAIIVARVDHGGN